MLQLHKLVISIGKLAEGYKKAGQFVQIKVGDSKPGFFAIASPPQGNSEGLVEVLIKDGGEGSTANLLCNVSQSKHSLWWHLQPAVCSSMSGGRRQAGLIA